MKKLLALLLASPIIYLNADDGYTATFIVPQIEVSMNCKVTGQSLLESIDGVAKTYSKFEDGLAVGDTFSLKFKFTESSNSKDYRLNVSTDFELGLLIFNRFNNTVSEKIGGSSDNNGIRYVLDDVKSYLREDYFMFEGILSKVSAKRYYKNDWHMMYIRKSIVGADVAHNLTANCMNMPSTWDEMINKIKSNEKDKWITDDKD